MRGPIPTTLRKWLIVDTRGWLTMAALAWIALPGFGQFVSGQVGGGAGQRHERQPYTAEFTVTSEQTLANGTTIRHESRQLIALDASGRRLNESITPAQGDRPERTSFHIYDPESKTNTNWTTPGNQVNVSSQPPATPVGVCWMSTMVLAGPAAEPTPTVEPSPGRPIGVARTSNRSDDGPVRILQKLSTTTSREDLGTQMIDGVEAKGTRTTRTTPTGTDGNDAPLVRTSETWVATHLNLVVREVTDDPRTGKRTRELVSIDLRDPDPGLYELPQGYEVMTAEYHQTPCSR